ncbi:MULTISPECIES: FAD-dependent thymidylate synthase [unclassified Corynebacterium]|uniref:FAD-dependent thymidylate synthase n=1 Tax=unclassified Corynebacterium TaxID=2624378 RepID=UPI00309A913F
MSDVVPLQVQLIAATSFNPPADIEWETDADGGEALIEFAGRACYETWDKPNERTSTNQGYLRHVLEVGHTSLFEHASASLYIRGLSRSCAHELVRHRHFSFAELSQRYVPDAQNRVVAPAAIANDPDLLSMFEGAVDQSRYYFEELLNELEEKWADEPNAVLRKKQARQAARSVLPNATETRIVVTGNYRSWRHFISMRAVEHADAEIRELAVACLQELKQVAPVAFGDFEVSTLRDGSVVASSPYAFEG